MNILDLPKFRKGWELRELSPKEGGGKWRFKLLHGIRLKVSGIVDDRVICYHDATGKTWARHDRFGLYVEEYYAWNGCSPKRWVWPFGYVGTPDFKSTLLASLCHDVHYQFSRTEHFPLHKSEVDALFRDTIAAHGDEDIARLYHAAVVKFGKWYDKPANGEFSTLL